MSEFEAVALLFVIPVVGIGVWLGVYAVWAQIFDALRDLSDRMGE